MDINKLEKLKEIGYSINRCCGNCNDSVLMPLTEWGVCKRFTYEHNKHTDKERFLSINRYGCCDSHTYTESYLEDINHFGDFIK